MKKLLSILSVMILSVMLFAQAPQSFSYQTVIRDVNWTVLDNQSVGIKIAVLEDAANGNVVYEESHSAITSQIGLVNLSVGEGAVISGVFSTIDWGNHNYFIEVAVDINGGSNYIVMGSTQLRSVPYALYAENSGTAGPQGPIGLTGPAGANGVDGVDGAVGAQGPIGLTGSQGIQGVPGNDGADGTNGLPGADGTNGVDGNDGIDGVDGAQGPIGLTGPQGIQGPAGNDGADGQDGTDGTDGVDGAIGAQGPIGLTGPQGIQGPVGNDGIAGVDGAQGIDGIDAVVDYDSLANIISADSSFTANVSGGMGGSGCDFIYPEGFDGEAIIVSLQSTTSYTVPSGKNLYVTNLYTTGYESFKIDNIIITNNIFNYYGSNTSPPVNPLILKEGQIITVSDDFNFNGYLVDENYFANCGGGGSSSASNATIDSLSQVVSNLDSALTALTSLFVFGCIDTAAFNYNSSANMNDGSCSYTPSIGDTYQAGIVFYLDGNGGGLIAAPTDQSFGASEWGCSGTSINTGSAIGQGAQNTLFIESGCTTQYTAADLCANLTLGGFSDWFLPSRYELIEMQQNIGQGDDLGLGNVGGFANAYYWSSTQYSSSSAVVKYFNTSSSGVNYHQKDNTYHVRAIRAF
jgi:hypothetical protein